MSSLESGNVRVVEENVVATADPPGDLGDDPYDDCLEAVFNYTITPQEAAEQIVRLTPSPNMEVASYGLYILWCGIVPRCLTRPEAHPALVDLLVALVNMPDAVGEDGQPLDVHKMRMWQDLPTFGWVMRYWWNCDPSQVNYEGWKNLNKFTALLTATGIKSLDYSLYALWQMRSALEDDKFEHPENEDWLNLEVPAAAQWIFFAGEELFRSSEEDSLRGGEQHNNAPGGRRWKGSHGYSLERWALWTARFREISIDEKASPSTRELARQAFEDMSLVSDD